MRTKFHFVKQPLIAFLVPLLQAYNTGHLRSSFTRTSVTKTGDPIPWYSLPTVNFLTQRDFSKARVLEFGGGYSTMWWSKAAEHVTTFEEDSRWINTFMSRVGANVEAHSLPSGLKGKELRVAISEKLNNTRALFDIVIVDAMHRETLTEMAFELVSEDGMVMVDNSEGYDTYEITKAKK